MPPLLPTTISHTLRLSGTMKKPSNEAKTYRIPRRRPAYLRTKTGCLPCRRRRKKCDENPGCCHTCKRLRIECIWSPGNHLGSPVVSSSPAPGDQNDDYGTSPSPSPSTPLTDVQESASLTIVDDEVTSDTATVSLSGSSPSLNQESPDMTVALSPSIFVVTSYADLHTGPFFEFMRAVFVPQLVMPTRDQGFTEKFTINSLQVAVHAPFFMDALLACAGAEYHIDNVFYRQLAESYYFKALGGLRTSLSGDLVSQEAETVALRTMLLLCMYEKYRFHPSKEVRMHLAGAAILVKARCRRLETRTLFSMSDDEVLTSVVMLESFIFHTATSIPFQAPFCRSPAIDDTFDTALRVLEQEVPDGGARATRTSLNFRILGAPPRLFAQVRQVALMYRHFQLHDELDTEQCSQLERELERYADELTQPVSLSESCTLEADTTLSLSSPSRFQSDYGYGYGQSHDDLTTLLGPRLYTITARILLRHMMMTALTFTIPSGPPIDPSSWDELLSEALSLVERTEPSMSFFADYYAWPFFCLGVCLSHRRHRRLLMDKITAFWEGTKNGIMRRVGVMLRDEWETSNIFGAFHSGNGPF